MTVVEIDLESKIVYKNREDFSSFTLVVVSGQ